MDLRIGGPVPPSGEFGRGIDRETANQFITSSISICDNLLLLAEITPTKASLAARATAAERDLSGILADLYSRPPKIDPDQAIQSARKIMQQLTGNHPFPIPPEPLEPSEPQPIEPILKRGEGMNATAVASSIQETADAYAQAASVAEKAGQKDTAEEYHGKAEALGQLRTQLARNEIDVPAAMEQLGRIIPT